MKYMDDVALERYWRISEIFFNNHAPIGSICGSLFKAILYRVFSFFGQNFENFSFFTTYFIEILTINKNLKKNPDFIIR